MNNDNKDFKGTHGVNVGLSVGDSVGLRVLREEDINKQRFIVDILVKAINAHGQPFYHTYLRTKSRAVGTEVERYYEQSNNI